MHIHPRRFFVFCLLLSFALTASAVIPPVEKLLPDDTLLLVTTPDYTKMRDTYRSSPQTQLWDDPSMKPFKENFLAKMNEQLIQPLEKDLGVHFSDYTNLPNGQITFAITQNGWPLQDGATPGILFLLDTKDKNLQLTKNLADIRKKWIEAGKTLRTEKIRNTDFSVLPISDKDIPKSLRKFSNKDASFDDGSTNEPNKTDIYIGQYESLLIVGTSARPIEKVLVHLTGGDMPSLGGLAAYEQNRLALFRDAPLYGWVNAKSFLDLVTKKTVKEDPDTPDPFAAFNPSKILAALGFNAIKTLAFSVQLTGDGSTIQFFASMPESSRQGIFAAFPSAKDSAPPSFVPADVVKFERWRLDGQKAWATLQKVLGDVSPQFTSGVNFIIDTANRAAKEKDPDFDINKNFFGNLGDDMMSYQKSPHGNTLADINANPSLFLLGSPNADQVVSSLKYLLVLANPQSASPKEREFLGRKIYSVPLPSLPGASFSEAPGGGRSLNYSASGGYVAMSSDASMIEEYLRSADSQQKSLRETPGLTDAIAKAGGSSTGVFGYENQVETTRTVFEALRSSASTNANTSAMMLSLSGLPTGGAFKDWLDFSLLPPFDKISKYFGFSVYTVGANQDGLLFKMFAPTPTGLRK